MRYAFSSDWKCSAWLWCTAYKSIWQGLLWNLSGCSYKRGEILFLSMVWTDSSHEKKHIQAINQSIIQAIIQAIKQSINQSTIQSYSHQFYSRETSRLHFWFPTKNRLYSHKYTPDDTVNKPASPSACNWPWSLTESHFSKPGECRNTSPQTA